MDCWTNNRSIPKATFQVYKLLLWEEMLRRPQSIFHHNIDKSQLECILSVQATVRRAVWNTTGPLDQHMVHSKCLPIELKNLVKSFVGFKSPLITMNYPESTWMDPACTLLSKFSQMDHWMHIWFNTKASSHGLKAATTSGNATDASELLITECINMSQHKWIIWVPTIVRISGIHH